MYLMNHSNGDVLEVTVNDQDHSIKKLTLYRQDGLGNYYFDPNAQLDDQNSLSTKDDVVRASKQIGGHNTHHIDKWHHTDPIFNAHHQVTGFCEKLELRHHTRIQNAKRYLRHSDHHHADFLFRNNHGIFMTPFNYLRNAIYQDRNFEMVLAHKVHKLAK